MTDLAGAFATAFRLIVDLDPDLVEIVALSLRVSGAALVLAALLGLPFGAAIGLLRFRGRRALIVLMNAAMGLPPVFVGLVAYMLLSRSGPLGVLELLYTPTAMVIAQTALVTPIVAALTRQAVEDLADEFDEQLRSLGAGFARRAGTLLYEGRFTLATTLLAGFGRAIAEVGAVIIVGGNIAHLTRVMTTAIVLETNRGDLPLALGLGIVLVVLAVLVNACAQGVQEVARRVEG